MEEDLIAVLLLAAHRMRLIPPVVEGPVSYYEFAATCHSGLNSGCMITVSTFSSGILMSFYAPFSNSHLRSLTGMLVG
jgi:hypothetical protein